MSRYIFLLISFASITLTISLNCMSGRQAGTCIDKSLCTSKGGTPKAGLCRGLPSNVQCCIGLLCGENGLCMDSSLCKKGTQKAGLCPGDAICCDNISCDNGNGLFMSQPKGKGTTLTNKGEGPSDIKCCIGGGSSPNPTPTVTPTPTPTQTPNVTPTPILSSVPSVQGERIAFYAEAEQKKGWPYSYGGGRYNGASYGNNRKKCDDTKVKGFDCSGITLYAVYQATGIKLDHNSNTQFRFARDNGYLVPTSQGQRGDLVFFGNENGDVHHVGVYLGNGKFVDAPGHNGCKGIKMRISDIHRKTLCPHMARFWK